MECPICGKWYPPDLETGYDVDTICPNHTTKEVEQWLCIEQFGEEDGGSMLSLNPDNKNSWEFLEYPCTLPPDARTRYLIVDGRKKRFKIWTRNGYRYRQNFKGECWRIKLFGLEKTSELLKDLYLPKIIEVFNKSSVFMKELQRR